MIHWHPAGFYLLCIAWQHRIEPGLYQAVPSPSIQHQNAICSKHRLNSTIKILFGVIDANDCRRLTFGCPKQGTKPSTFFTRLRTCIPRLVGFNAYYIKYIEPDGSCQTCVSRGIWRFFHIFIFIYRMH